MHDEYCRSMFVESFKSPPTAGSFTREAMGRLAMSLPEFPEEILFYIFDLLENSREETPSTSTLIPSARWLRQSISRDRTSLAAGCRSLYRFYRFNYCCALDCSRVSWEKLDRLEPADFTRLFNRFPKISFADIALTGELSQCLWPALRRHRSPSHATSMRGLILHDSTLDDVAIEELVRVCPHLQVLHLSGCDNLSDQGLRAITSSLHNLRELTLDAAELSLFEQFSEDGAETLCALTQLEHLSLEYRMDLSMSTIARALSHMPYLMSLSLSNTRVSIDELEIALPNLKSLESLKIACCRPTSAQRLSRALPRSVQSLDIRGTVQLSDEDVTVLVRRLPRLVALEAGCASSTFRTLACFGSSLAQLRMLRLCNAEALGDSSTAEALRGMWELRSLALLGSVLLGDQTIAACASLPRLQTFHVSEECISPEAAEVLENVVKSHRSLRNLKFIASPGISEQHARFRRLTKVVQALGGSFEHSKSY